MIVFFSCGDALNEIGFDSQTVEIDAATPRQLIEILEVRQGGWRDRLLQSDGSLRSDVALFTNIVPHANERLLDGNATRALRSLADLDDPFQHNDVNLLISLFRPNEIVRFLLDNLAGEAPSDSSARNPQSRALSPSWAEHNGQTLFARADPEPIYAFTQGRPVAELLTRERICVELNQLLPDALAKALAVVLDASPDLNQFRLRAFQEDVLRHVLEQLGRDEEELSAQPLLLSIPTGGGKTEAFLAPLLARLLDERLHALQSGRTPIPTVKAMIVYPTRALANDQARRLAQILSEVNAQAALQSPLALGVLTGDTPRSHRQLSVETSLLQLCPRCGAVLTQFGLSDNAEQVPLSIARCGCGAEIDCFRFTREDILTQPPDILVISPDMISRTLQLPHFNSRLFTPQLRAIVFDEIHSYSGVFGCHVAHLLRRVEAACGAKPLYLGVSATIRNAREVACALFDVAAQNVRYLRPKTQDEIETSEKRAYLDYDAGTARYRHHYAIAPGRVAGGRFAQTTTATVDVAQVIGHLSRDSHFRKTLIFSNGRDAVDDIVRFGREQEERLYAPFVHELWPRLQAMDMAGRNGLESFSAIENRIIRAVGGWYERARQSGNLYQPTLEWGWHRGGLEAKERLRAVNRLVSTQKLSATRGSSPWPLDVLVATSTLELGLDIGDVSVVINCGAPPTVNEYVQRTGRGGRRKDALAITIVNPSNPLDRRFLRRFERHARPEMEDFEAVPLVVANEEVTRSHLLAQLLDSVAQASGSYTNDGTPNLFRELCVGDLRRFTVYADGKSMRLSDDPHSFALALWDELFSPAVLEDRFTWLRREAQLVQGAQQTALTPQDWRRWWISKCESLGELLKRPEVMDEQSLTGANALDRELVPDLRGVGATVGLFWRTLSGDEKQQDTIARGVAMSARPQGGTASQGSASFRIKNTVPDLEAQQAFTRLLRQPGVERATTYFHRAFGAANNELGDDQKTGFPSDPRDVRLDVSFVTPRDLEIEFSPARFYCVECGATYSHKKPGDRMCSSCHAELRQLTEFYQCGGCGETFDPPVPKVCLNPDCIARARNQRTGAALIDGDYKRINRGNRHNSYFRFSALPRLHWQCRACQNVINFHAHYELPSTVRRIMDAGKQEPLANQIARHFLWEPEAWWSGDYQEQGFHKACFSCPKCRDSGGFRKISVVNAPKGRSALHQYILHGPTMGQDISEGGALLSFELVQVLSLARERHETFYSGTRRTSQTLVAPIFPNSPQYLASHSYAHAAFLRFGDALDFFLKRNPIARVCDVGKGDCPCHLEDNAGQSETALDDVEINFSAKDDETRPAAYLMPWERGRTPDPRRKWCDVAAGRRTDAVCPGSHQACSSCNYFEPSRFNRYLIIHTLEHAILAALPLYTGATRGQIRGIINPNDEDEHDLALMDSVEGGSGCLYLLRQNWPAIWKLAGEILRDARRDPDLLLLAHGCERFNHDLCPDLAHEFYEFTQKEAK